jgi:Arc/MetJ-type ribon-helix-helix transcriptional regulator
MGITLTPELEERIAAKMRSGFYQSPSEVVRASLDLLEARDKAASKSGNGTDTHDSRPVWERIVAIGQAVPPEAWDAVPSDLSMNLDHYLYGAPKVESEAESD